MEQRNLILAAVLSVGILLLWQFLYEMPRMEQHRSELARQAELKKETLPNKLRPEAPNQTPTGPKGIPQPNTNVLPPTTQLAPIPGVAPSQDLMRRSEIQRSAAISRVKRLQIVGERIKGSISLNGGRIDDLILRGYRETVDPNSPEITLLSPIGAPKPYYAQFGWTALDKDISLPNDTTVWKTNRSTLTPQQPVTLTWNNGKGLVFKRVISIDKNYLFKITQLVENKTSKSITL